MVASELRVGSLQGRVTVGLGFLDTIARRVKLVIRRSIQTIEGGIRRRSVSCAKWKSATLEEERTRYGEPSCSGCAETSSWTLRKDVSQSNRKLDGI